MNMLFMNWTQTFTEFLESKTNKLAIGVLIFGVVKELFLGGGGMTYILAATTALFGRDAIAKSQK